jgi:hypothetical protein
MPRTILEVQAELTTVSAAIQELITGTRLTQLRVGSGDFARLYTHQEVSLENLQEIKQQLLQELADLENTDGIVFRTNSNVRTITRKFR